MVYELALDMGVVDFAIKAAIKELSDGDKPLTADQIAAHIGCAGSTVRRTLPRLIKAGIVVRHGSKRNGYWYQVQAKTKGVNCYA
jgi:predicted transcriptional regulator